jgi:predicted PolB exonuclease-like 3'-5' exonuclease
MNNRIKKLTFDKLLFVDIETSRKEKVFTVDSPNYDVWEWKQRDRSNNTIPPSEDVIAAYYNKAALSPEWGMIVCISVGVYTKNRELKLKSFTGEEKDILSDFVSMVKKSKRMLAGFNLIGFDVPYIRKRYFINGLSDYLTETQGNDVYAKPWDLDSSIFDLMVAWKGSGYMTSSLDEVAMCFGVPTSKGDLKGNEVSDSYHAGEITRIAEYCEEDVRVVAEILQAWQSTVQTQIQQGDRVDPFKI